MKNLDIGIKEEYSAEEMEFFRDSGPFSDSFLANRSEVAIFLSDNLSIVYHEFVVQMRSAPIIAKLENEGLSLDEYKVLIKDLRAQVVDGVSWLLRTASGFPPSLIFVRNQILKHAAEESSDYTMLDNDYVKAGGNLEEIQTAYKNIGAQALSDFIFWNSSAANAYGLAGALFVFESQPFRTGWNRWQVWSTKLEVSGVDRNCLTFFRSHAEKDMKHSRWIETLFSMPFATLELAKDVVRTAKIVAKLYSLQFETIKRY